MTIHWPEQEYNHLLNQLRAWLTIDWQPDKSHPLLGGMSGAVVTRLTMKWETSAPTLTHQATRSATPVGSTVVKVGALTALMQEKAAFAQIPVHYQRYFSRILSGPHRLEQEQMAYLLLEDLAGYRTLYDALCCADESVLSAITEQLVAFLQRFYQMPISAEREVEVAAFIESLYLCPMVRSLQKLEQCRHYLLDFADNYTAIQAQLVRLRRGIVDLEQPPCTVMHGDLHLRNIMLCEVRAETGDIDFRLIDLDKFSDSGDLAYDIGKLLVDLEVGTAAGQLPSHTVQLSQTLEAAVHRAAPKRADRSFALRLSLAKAYSQLRVIELYVKQLFIAHNINGTTTSKEPTLLLQLNLEQIQAYLQQALTHL